MLPEAIRAAEEGLNAALRLDDPLLLYRGYEAVQLLYWTAGDIGRYRSAIEAEALLLDRLPSVREKVDALVAIAGARIEAGRYREGLETSELAFELAEELSRHERMHVSFALMWAADLLGDWDRLIEVLPWHLEAAAAEPDVSCPHVRGGPSLGGIVLFRRGEAERASELVPVDTRAIERETLFDRALAAMYAAMVGSHDVASAIVDRMIVEPGRDRYPDGLAQLIETLALLGRRDQLERYVQTARRLGEADVLLVPIADRLEAELLIAKGRADEAGPLLHQALARFEELAVPFEGARTRELLADLVEPGRRRQLLEEALETYEHLRARPAAERVRKVIDQLEAAGSHVGGGGSNG